MLFSCVFPLYCLCLFYKPVLYVTANSPAGQLIFKVKADYVLLFLFFLPEVALCVLYIKQEKQREVTRMSGGPGNSCLWTFSRCRIKRNPHQKSIKKLSSHFIYFKRGLKSCGEFWHPNKMWPRRKTLALNLHISQINIHTDRNIWHWKRFLFQSLSATNADIRI